MYTFHIGIQSSVSRGMSIITVFIPFLYSTPLYLVFYDSLLYNIVRNSGLRNVLLNLPSLYSPPVFNIFLPPISLVGHVAGY